MEVYKVVIKWRTVYGGLAAGIKMPLRTDIMLTYAGSPRDAEYRAAKRLDRLNEDQGLFTVLVEMTAKAA